MKNTGKYASLPLVFLFCACLPFSAAAQMNYYNAEGQATAERPEEQDTAGNEAKMPEEETPQPAKNFTVTSIQKCYERLGREETLDIQKGYIKPYQECQRRLALKLKKEREEKLAKPKEKTEKRRGYHRVRKDPDPKKTAEKADSEDKNPP